LATDLESARAQIDPDRLRSLPTVCIVKLSEIISRGVAHVYETKFDLKSVELRILLHLGRDEALTGTEISRRTNVDKGWISRSLEAMMRRGLVVRSQHASDNRITLISLTEQGHELLDTIAPFAIARNDRLLAGFNRREVVALLEALSERATEMLEEDIAHERASREDGHASV
jgi:DNA-binding MarR family transcriptional regulator